MSSSNSADLRWQALLKDFPRSGLTHLEFCRLRGISLHTFRKKLYGQKAVAPATPRDGAALPAARFLPVAIPAAPFDSARPADPLVLVLAGGRRLAVAEGFDPETLHRLIDALERRP